LLDEGTLGRDLFGEGWDEDSFFSLPFFSSLDLRFLFSESGGGGA